LNPNNSECTKGDREHASGYPHSGGHDLVDANPSVTPATLNALLTEAPEPILVSFQAPGWEALVPASRKLVDIFGARLRVVHVDLSAYPDLAVRFKIRVIPTLLLFIHGVLTEFIVGMIPIRFLVEMLSTALGVRADLHAQGGSIRGDPRGSTGDVP
jgi:thioredoxin-like negative regulator of GroEL